MKNYAIILASGTGSRYGENIPKQFTKIGNKTIFELTLSSFEGVNGTNGTNGASETNALNGTEINNKSYRKNTIDEIIAVVTPNYVDFAKELIRKNHYKKVSKIVAGGEIRKESSYIGINSIDEKEANVLIHDCARPFVSERIINECINALEIHNAVGVAIPSTDTIIEVESGKIKSIPKRETLMRVQTPQCFKLSLIKKAHELSRNDNDFTDDCGLIVKYNLADVFVVEGERQNFKITYPEDIIAAKSILQDKQ